MTSFPIEGKVKEGRRGENETVSVIVLCSLIPNCTLPPANTLPAPGFTSSEIPPEKKVDSSLEIETPVTLPLTARITILSSTALLTHAHACPRHADAFEYQALTCVAFGAPRTLIATSTCDGISVDVPI